MTDMKTESDNSENYGRNKALELRRKVLDLAGPKGLSILDIGAGPLAIFAVKKYDCTVTSVDIDRDKIETWRKEAEKEGVSGRITFKEEDVTALSFADDEFDMSLCFGSLHHIAPGERKKAVSEISRVSRGRIVISDFTTEGLPEIHPGGEFEPVDHGRLKEILESKGSLEIIPLEKMMVYIVEKGKGPDGK
jgi:ubiquinone/menaquinone biosynthesis C-methylase UbiE